MAKKFRLRFGGKKKLHLAESPQSGSRPTSDGDDSAAESSRVRLPKVKLTRQSMLAFARQLFRWIRYTLAWGAFALLTAGLLLSMMTAQSPLNVVMGRPPVSDRMATKDWFNEQQQYGATQVLSISDDGSLMASVLTDDTGSTLRIDSHGDVTKSAQVLFKDYSLFVWADSRSSVWLHRGSKTLQKFDPSGELLWQKQFDAWPETCWSSGDGYLLVALQDEGLNQSLVLISPRNQELWAYSLNNAAVIDAAVAPEGKGVALAVLKLDSATPQAFGYLLDSTGRVAKVNSLDDGVPRQASISSDGTVAAIGGMYKAVVLKQAPEEVMLEIDLKYELRSLEVGGQGNILAIASAIDPGFIFENNKTALQVHSLEDGKQLWTWQLSEELRALSVAEEEDFVFVTTQQRFQAFSLEGNALWGIGSQDVGAALRSVVISPSGQNIGILDSKFHLSTWEAPGE